VPVVIGGEIALEVSEVFAITKVLPTATLTLPLRGVSTYGAADVPLVLIGLRSIQSLSENVLPFRAL
jgi:hypothetical protein